MTGPGETEPGPWDRRTVEVRIVVQPLFVPPSPTQPVVPGLPLPPPPPFGLSRFLSSPPPPPLARASPSSSTTSRARLLSTASPPTWPRDRHLLSYPVAVLADGCPTPTLRREPDLQPHPCLFRSVRSGPRNDTRDVVSAVGEERGVERVKVERVCDWGGGSEMVTRWRTG